MLLYWCMFLVPAAALLMPYRLVPRQGRWAWLAVGLLFAIVIGLRHEVGGDWFSYLPHFLDTAQLGLGEVMRGSDPGYYLLNWLMDRTGGDIYWVNFSCALVLMGGTVVFCRAQPNPWLALLVAVPYMLIVVGMGYTRQAAALGLALLGLEALGKGRMRMFLLWVVLGALFHRSAVLLLPIAGLAGSRNRLLTAALVLLATGLMYVLLLDESVGAMWNNYVTADMESEGGGVRVLMNALPAALLLLFGRRLVPDRQERRLWLWMTVFAMACIPLVAQASTAVDRIALYLIPLQLFVFARLPRLATTPRGRTPIVLAVVGYYAAVQFVWLNYASHSQYWLPYQFMPL